MSYLTQPLAVALGLTLTLSTGAFAAGNACDYERHTAIAFTDAQVNDKLIVHVTGPNCDEAELSITVVTDNNELAYDYSGRLVDHLPFSLHGAELAEVVPTFISSLLGEASHRSTENLLPYTNPTDFYEASNDFVTIDPAVYEALRHQQQTVLWHTTGDSSWVNLVYDGTSGKSKVIMRGGVFNK